MPSAPNGRLRSCWLVAASLTALGACAPAAVRIGLDPTLFNTRVSPCEDFFEHACGGWLARTEIPSEQARWSRGFSELGDRNIAVARAHLEGSRPPAGGDTPALRQARTYYAACMDRGAHERAGLLPLAPLFAKIDAVKDADTLVDALAALHEVGARALFDFSSTQDLKETTRVTGEVDQAGLGLPDRDYYLKDDEPSRKIRQSYLRHVARMLELGGAAPAQSATDASTIVALETRLAQASLSRLDRREPAKLHHRLELTGLQEKAPRLPWKRYLTARRVGAVTEINVTAPDFAARVSELVEKTPAADWRAYLRWHLLHGTASALPRRFLQEDFDFGRAFSGAKQLMPRWKRCFHATDAGVGESLAQSWVAQTFGAEGKSRALEMVHEIEAAFGERAKQLPWMDELTRTRAMEKLATIANQIGYPNKWREYPFTVDAKDFLGNKLRASADEQTRQIAKIGRPVDRDDWHMTPPTVNAYYQAQLNQMVFPAGILQPPFFHATAPLPVNYGAIGMVVGHELTHGFDDKGRKFDASGNLRDWWSEAAGKDFTERAQCVVRQFEEVEPLPGLKLNGKLMLGENIADLGGLKLAYAALQRRQQKAALPLHEGKTPEQQFFLAYAQAWCFKARPEFQRLAAKIDPHAPARLRVNGPLSNLKAFQKAFSCPAGAKMVRPADKRCSVW